MHDRGDTNRHRPRPAVALFIPGLGWKRHFSAAWPANPVADAEGLPVSSPSQCQLRSNLPPPTVRPRRWLRSLEGDSSTSTLATRPWTPPREPTRYTHTLWKVFDRCATERDLSMHCARRERPPHVSTGVRNPTPTLARGGRRTHAHGPSVSRRYRRHHQPHTTTTHATSRHVSG